LPRPDFLQAVGDVLAFSGKAGEAKAWHDRALAGYLHSVDQGEVHFYHHLASFFSDVREQSSEAIKYARKDRALRHSAAAHEALAWALYRRGDFPQAVAELQQALANGGHNAHLCYHAGMIFSVAGDLEQGRKFLRETLGLNPHYNAFHVHR
jgi:tetratricopeptide (TPR) repeat protein